MSTHRQLTDEFGVKVYNDELGLDIEVCGLCGNCGVLDTRKSATWKGKNVGIKTYCVCLNGRARKRQNFGEDLWKAD